MRRGDTAFLVILSSILFFGLVMLTSATAPGAYKQFGDSFFFLKRQLLHGFLPGLVGFFIFSRLDYRRLARLAPFAFFLVIALLAFVFIPSFGQDYGRTRSWIGMGAFSFQPAEPAKLLFIIVLAAYFAKWGSKRPAAIPFLSLLGIVAALLIAQPDVGTLAVIVSFSLIMYYVARAPLVTLFGLGALNVLIFTWLIKSAPYRAQRLMIFLHPELDPQGVGYHINQALLAIGSGGLFGLGLGHSRQKFQYLPEVHGDSIFAVISEELGFFVALTLLAAFVYIIFRGVKIAQNAPDDFGKYLSLGIISWVGAQTFLNIGSMVGLLPLTGLPLPFISYGGTAMTALLTAVGILWNVSAQTRRRL